MAMPEFDPPADTIEVQTILEPVQVTEFTVPVAMDARPEAVLLRAIADHLDDAPEHLAVVAVQMSYIAYPFPMVHGTLCTALAVPD